MMCGGFLMINRLCYCVCCVHYYMVAQELLAESENGSGPVVRELISRTREAACFCRLELLDMVLSQSTKNTHTFLVSFTCYILFVF